jgi:hypothetical protein
MTTFEKWSLGCILIGAVIAFVGLLLLLRRNTVSIEPQPVAVEKAPKRFSKDLCDFQHREINQHLGRHDTEIARIWEALRIELPAMERRINAAGEERVSKVHDRINEVLAAVSELRGKNP